MGLEIEKKFLVKKLVPLIATAKSISIRQGYIQAGKSGVVRIRLYGDKAFLTIKGKTIDSACPEYEYEIPVQDAEDMLSSLCKKPLIEKKRYLVEFKGFQWIIDEFFNENSGLIVAEIELEFRKQPFDIPPWADQEVTGDPKYYNASLISNPYSHW
ncbi:MAG: CYTH domain-containing protein [Desulfobacteraceae bacterium]|nr:CYTH domain-containing protein [Desulfobacteraceae bacterium]